MGRDRGTKRDSALPEYVYRIRSKDRVIWREYAGRGRFGKTVTLRDDRDRPLPADAPHRAILAAYQRQIAKDTGHTLGWLLDAYMGSPRFLELGKATRRGYQFHAETIRQKLLKTGGKRFGEVPLRLIDPPVIAKYRDARAEAKVSANRELQFLSAVFSWAIEQGHAQANPCKGVRKFPGQRRERYIEDWELELVQGLAPDHIAVMMELAYLLRARRSEVLALTREDIFPQGVYLDRGKGSESEVTKWTPALEAAIKAAKAINRDVISPHLLRDRHGQPFKPAALDTAWQRLMKKAIGKGLKERFTFHDIKAKGVTDHKEQWAGHKSARMAEVYIRKAREIDATR